MRQKLLLHHLKCVSFLFLFKPFKIDMTPTHTLFQGDIKISLFKIHKFKALENFVLSL